MVCDLSLFRTGLNFCLWNLDVLIFEISFLNRLRSNPAGKFNIWEAIKHSFNTLGGVNYQKTE